MTDYSGQTKYTTIHGAFTRDELMDFEGWSNYDMLDYDLPVRDVMEGSLEDSNDL